MLKLTFTDEKRQVKVLGESEDAGELYRCMYQHMRRLFIHPTIIPPGKLDPKSSYILAQTKNGCTYEIENTDEPTPPRSGYGGCQVKNTL